MIESSSTALENINIVREKLKLKKIVKPWHNLYLDDKKIIKTKFKNIRLLEIKELFSTYYFISRTKRRRFSPVGLRSAWVRSKFEPGWGVFPFGIQKS